MLFFPLNVSRLKLNYLKIVMIDLIIEHMEGCLTLLKFGIVSSL